MFREYKIKSYSKLFITQKICATDQKYETYIYFGNTKSICCRM